MLIDLILPRNAKVMASLQMPRVTCVSLSMTMGTNLLSIFYDSANVKYCLF